jgi:uncharacterized membrane protein
VPGSAPSSARPEPDDESDGGSTQALFASVFAFLAVLTTVLSVYGLGTDYDRYITYGAGALGFLSVLFGFAGLGQANRAGSGRVRSYLAIVAGFLAIGLNTYEYMYAQELHDKIAGLFGG